MSTASSTATTSTVNVTSQPNVHYNLGTSDASFSVAPHAPSER